MLLLVLVHSSTWQVLNERNHMCIRTSVKRQLPCQQVMNSTPTVLNSLGLHFKPLRQFGTLKALDGVLFRHLSYQQHVFTTNQPINTSLHSAQKQRWVRSSTDHQIADEISIARTSISTTASLGPLGTKRKLCLIIIRSYLLQQPSISTTASLEQRMMKVVSSLSCWPLHTLSIDANLFLLSQLVIIHNS